jgi:hypothetical protein
MDGQPRLGKCRLVAQPVKEPRPRALSFPFLEVELHNFSSVPHPATRRQCAAVICSFVPFYSAFWFDGCL